MHIIEMDSPLTREELLRGLNSYCVDCLAAGRITQSAIHEAIITLLPHPNFSPEELGVPFQGVSTTSERLLADRLNAMLVAAKEK